jgi:hypothetical protein
MPNQGMKILTGTTVTLLLSAVAVGPAMAGPSAEVAQRQQVSQMNGAKTIRGTIKSIVGEVVKVQEANGNVIELRLSKRNQGILGLVSGMDIVAQVASGRVLNIAMATAASSQMASSTRSTSTNSGSSTSSGSRTNSTTTITRPGTSSTPSMTNTTRPVMQPQVQPPPAIRQVTPPPAVQPMPAPAAPQVIPAPPTRPSVTVPRAMPAPAAPVRALW